jgi:hypothetical protein
MPTLEQPKLARFLSVTRPQQKFLWESIVNLWENSRAKVVAKSRQVWAKVGASGTTGSASCQEKTQEKNVNNVYTNS